MTLLCLKCRVAKNAEALPACSGRHALPVLIEIGVQDFDKGTLQHFQQALKHYDSLADRMNQCGHTLDVFACSLDQVGIAEMHPAVHYTGKCVTASTLHMRQSHDLLFPATPMT